jgi:hypothetical protein
MSMPHRHLAGTAVVPDSSVLLALPREDGRFAIEYLRSPRRPARPIGD